MAPPHPCRSAPKVDPPGFGLERAATTHSVAELPFFPHHSPHSVVLLTLTNLPLKLTNVLLTLRSPREALTNALLKLTNVLLKLTNVLLTLRSPREALTNALLKLTNVLLKLTNVLLSLGSPRAALSNALVVGLRSAGPLATRRRTADEYRRTFTVATTDPGGGAYLSGTARSCVVVARRATNIRTRSLCTNLRA